MWKDKWAIAAILGLGLLFYGTSALGLSLFEDEVVINIFSRGKIYILSSGGLVVSFLFVLFNEIRK